MGPTAEDAWRRKLDGSDQGFRPLRRFWRSLPTGPRCKMCLRPFAGPGGALMRMVRLGPWEKNPRFCRGCYQSIDAHRGGAEVEVSMLFADVRGSTGLAEGMSPRAFTELLIDSTRWPPGSSSRARESWTSSSATRSSAYSFPAWPGWITRGWRSRRLRRCSAKRATGPMSNRGFP